MQQARTHRVGVSFDVQSMRYTGERICRAADGDLDLEEVFYLRPIGDYSDRQGKKYAYTAAERQHDLDHCQQAAERYRDLLRSGFAEEHARGILPFDYRQHFVVSFSLRAFLHSRIFARRRPAGDSSAVRSDVPHMVSWAPQFAEWYESGRLHRARPAPRRAMSLFGLVLIFALPAAARWPTGSPSRTAAGKMPLRHSRQSAPELLLNSTMASQPLRHVVFTTRPAGHRCSCPADHGDVGGTRIFPGNNSP